MYATEFPRRLKYWCCKAKEEVACIAHPNVAGWRLLKRGLDNLCPHPCWLGPARADLCPAYTDLVLPTPTYVPQQLMRQLMCWDMCRHTFGRPLTWPYPCTKADQTRQSKTIKSDVRNYKDQKFCYTRNTIYIHQTWMPHPKYTSTGILARPRVTQYGQLA